MIEKTGGRPPGVVQAEPSPQAPHAALLVDFDNVTMGIRSDLQNQLRKLLNSDIIRGKVSVQRAYADWRRYPQYIVPLTEASIDLIFAPAVGANKKNATDIRLAIDALELVFTRPEIGTYILLSGDSDFSALVLKLKEYGKFVIGVGIRESSSDLLMQNCDEYYSYNELTGLARTGEIEVVRRDPWELVVEAVHKMSQSGDVMRSDRLKQVMQSIDPNFDEKDVGCNRFSKFVLEAGQRGLVKLTKMENGQYAVDVGPNANVTVDREPLAGTPAADSPTPPRRKRTTRSRGERDSKPRTLTLAESLELLKRALQAVGALGEESTQAEAARERMIEIHGNEADPIFEPKRFQRLLRQAHDADVIELIKSDGDDYMLKLSASAVTEMESAKAPTGQEKAEGAEAAEAGGEGEKADEEPKKKTTKRKTTKKKTTKTAKKTTKKKTTRSRTKAAAKDDVEEAVAEEAVVGAEAVTTGDMGVAVGADEPKKKTSKRKTTRKKTTRTRKKVEEEEKVEEIGDGGAREAVEKPIASAPFVNPRFRKGSRSAAPKPAAKDKPASSEQAPKTEPEIPALKVSDGPRSLGIRSGSRSAKRSQPTSPKEESPEAPEKPKAAEPKVEPKIAEPKVASAPPTPPKKPEARPQPEPLKEKPKQRAAVEPPAEPEDDGAGLFKRVTAAFQRAMGTPKGEDE